MGLKRRNRVSPNFSMASMTDVIFLLLIFFMITSTVVSPNAIKVLLPQGKQQTSAKPLTRVVIDKDLNFYAAFGNEKEQPVALNDLTSFLQSCAEKEPEMYVALYADESVPYREIVRVLNIANENHFKMVLATRPPENTGRSHRLRFGKRERQRTRIGRYRQLSHGLLRRMEPRHRLAFGGTDS